MNTITLMLSAAIVAGALTASACSLSNELSGGDDELGEWALTEPEVRALTTQLSLEVSYVLGERNGVSELRPSIIATNGANLPIRITLGAWPWRFSAYATAERRVPIWQQPDHRGPDIGLPFEMEPGGVATFDGGWWVYPSSVLEILGDNPPGTYYFSVALQLSDSIRTAELPAGEFYLPGAETPP